MLLQMEVDQIRLDILTSMLFSKVRYDDYSDPIVQHVRFPENRITYYLIRDGNPPANADRNKWERNLRLELDLGPIDQDLRKDVENLRNLKNIVRHDVDQFQAIRNLMIAKIAKRLQKIMGAEFKGSALTDQDYVALQTYEEAAVKDKIKSAAQKSATSKTIYPKMPRFIHSDKSIL